MPRYFFNRADGHDDPDREGIELKDQAEARQEAIIFASDTLKDTTYALWDGGQVRIEVRDESQALLFTVFISAVNAND